MTFEAPGELLDDSAREATLDEIQSFGVTRVRALVYWNNFTARPNRRQADVRHGRSERLSGGTWDRLDHLVDSIRTPRHDAAAHAHRARCRNGRPEAQGQHRRPGRKLFGRWARAVATRYGDRMTCGRSGTSRTTRPSSARSTRTASPTRRSSTASSTCRGGRDPRHRRQRARQGPVRRDRADRQPERRLPARLPPRRAVPEQELRGEGLQEVADRRLRAPCLHAQGGPDVRVDRPRRGQHRLARPAHRGARQGREGRADRQARHLPDRVRDPEQAGPDRGRLALTPGRVHRDRRADGLRQPARDRVLPVPDGGRRPAERRPPGALLGLRDRPGTSKGKNKPAYTAFMLPLAATRYGSTTCSGAACGRRPARPT